MEKLMAIVAREAKRMPIYLKVLYFTLVIWLAIKAGEYPRVGLLARLSKLFESMSGKFAYLVEEADLPIKEVSMDWVIQNLASPTP